jgi:putative tricarboxylic transport membrane protein
MDRRVDFGISIGIVGFGIFILVASAFGRSRASFDPIGPYGFARVIGVAFVLLGIVLIARQVRAYRANLPPEAVAQGSEDEEGHPASSLRAIAMMAAAFGYALLMIPLGYIITTFAFVVGGMALMREYGMKWIVPVAIVYTAATWYVFASLLNVPMPLGPLGQLFLDLGLVERLR